MATIDPTNPYNVGSSYTQAGYGTPLGTGVPRTTPYSPGPVAGSTRGSTSYSYPTATTMLRAAYQKYLGRDPSDAEIFAQLGGHRLPDGTINRSGLDYTISSMAGSPEGLEYAKKPTVTTSPPDETPGTPDTSSKTPTSPVTATGGIPAPTQPAPSQTETSMSALMNQILANPRSLSDEVVNMMKEKGKETAVSGERMALDKVMNRLAGQGMLDSGAATAQEVNLNDLLTKTITSGNRDIDIARAQQDRADEQNAINQALQVVLAQGGATLDWEKLRQAVNQFNLGNQLNWSSLLANYQGPFYGSMYS